jgi:hypothetical protein
MIENIIITPNHTIVSTSIANQAKIIAIITNQKIVFHISCFAFDIIFIFILFSFNILSKYVCVSKTLEIKGILTLFDNIEIHFPHFFSEICSHATLKTSVHVLLKGYLIVLIPLIFLYIT